MSADLRRPSIVATPSAAKSIDQRSDKCKSRKKWWIVLGVVIGVSVTIMVTSLSICYSDHRSIEICWNKFYKFLEFPTKTEEIITECSTNDDCSGASDTCKANICYCGSEEKCTETTDTCTAVNANVGYMMNVHLLNLVIKAHAPVGMIQVELRHLHIPV